MEYRLTRVACINKREDGRPDVDEHDAWPAEVEARRAPADSDEEVAEVLRDVTDTHDDDGEAEAEEDVVCLASYTLGFCWYEQAVFRVEHACEVAHDACQGTCQCHPSANLKFDFDIAKIFAVIP